MSRVFVGEIEVLLQMDDAEELLTEGDWRDIELCVAESRRSERFAWRVLLRRSLRRMGYGDDVVGANVVYDEHGAPWLEGCDSVFIGVSHSRRRVAVAISHALCAVDLELVDRNFGAISQRFLGSVERELLSAYDQAMFALPLAWAAKEVLYKLSGVDGLELIGDMELLAVDTVGCTVDCCALRGRFSGDRLRFGYMFEGGHVMVWRL